MTSSEKFNILTAYAGVISANKIFLSDTDYQVIREAEGEKPERPEIKEQRTAARATINQYEQWYAEVEAIVPEDPDRPIEKA